jgi:hypothetical protein
VPSTSGLFTCPLEPVVPSVVQLPCEDDTTAPDTAVPSAFITATVTPE